MLGLSLPDSRRRRIAFISKAFVKGELKWATIQKEAFPIYFYCKQLNHLLSGLKFTILSDHRNLLYLKSSSDPRIVRWNVALQELDYDMAYIPGSQNVVADAMSRLCENHMHDDPNELDLRSMDISASVIEKFEIPQEQYDIIATVPMGIRATMKRLMESKELWAHVRQRVKHFVKHWPVCQKLSAVKFSSHAHPFTTSTYESMQCLNIDFIGPFPDKGYIFFDTFTRWFKLYHTPDATAKSATQCLIKHFGRFGAPAQIRSDNGPHFSAEVFREFLDAVVVRHCRTTPYSGEENSLVERTKMRSIVILGL